MPPYQLLSDGNWITVYARCGDPSEEQRHIYIYIPLFFSSLVELSAVPGTISLSSDLSLAIYLQLSSITIPLYSGSFSCPHFWAFLFCNFSHLDGGTFTCSYREPPHGVEIFRIIDSSGGFICAWGGGSLCVVWRVNGWVMDLDLLIGWSSSSFQFVTDFCRLAFVSVFSGHF